MKKKLISICTLSLVLLVTFSSACLAMNNNDEFQIKIDNKIYTAYISEEPTPYGDPAVDPIPHPLGIMSKAAVVTESDVWRAQVDDPDYPNEYVAIGYVTMMDGSKTAYHYSIAQMWWQGSLDKTGTKRWGYGRVDANSYPTPNPGTAKIFYGTN